MNTNEPCDVRVTFGDGQSVVIEKLSLRQQHQLGELLQASGVRYHWNAWFVGRPTASERIGGLWRRMLAWMQPLLLLAALSPLAFAQRAVEPKPVEPIRVSLALAERTADNREFDDHLRDELNKFKDLVIASRRADFNITTVTTKITVRGEVIGYCAAVLIITPGRGAERFRLSVETGATLPDMAADLARYLDKEFFETKRRR